MAGGAFVLYHYNPSLGAAITFAILFALSLICHTYQLLRHRTWYFIPFLIGCIFEVLGYVGRAISAEQTPNWTTGPYIMQTLLLLLGPVLLAASIYMTLGRLIRLVDADSYSLVRPSWITKFFVLGDVLSFLTQSGGGGILAASKTQAAKNTAEYIITGGLVLQVTFFGFFILVAALFHRRLAANPTAAAKTVRWRRCLGVLYLASALILVRSVFRVIEFATGYDGALQASEVYLYVFDAALMILVVVTFNIVHPSSTIVGEIRPLHLDSRVPSGEVYQLHDQSTYAEPSNQYSHQV